MRKRNIYISALLKDDMIIAYKISGNLKQFPHDYYKDFYYANVETVENVDKEYEVKYISVEVDDDISTEFNNYIFETFAKEFYKQWKIHPNHFGQAAY
jgi:hypothetical protein